MYNNNVRSIFKNMDLKKLLRSIFSVLFITGSFQFTAFAQGVSVPDLSIPGLRSRSFQAEGFKLLDTVTANKGLYAQEFSFRSEGYLVYGLIERPVGEPPEAGWPVIVLAHGHIPPKAYSTERNYRLVSQYYAKGGFLVVKPDYRGHGRSQGDSEGTASWIFDYTVDSLNLTKEIKSIPDADSHNIFLYGHSMGGEIALRALMVDSNTFKGATLWAAMSEDFPENLMYYVGRSADGRKRFQSRIDEVFTEDQYKILSLSPYLDSIKTPLLIHHGTSDESVPYSWSTALTKKLDAVNVDYTFYSYPEENHNISHSFYKVLDKDMEFFRTLMD